MTPKEARSLRDDLSLSHEVRVRRLEKRARELIKGLLDLKWDAELDVICTGPDYE